jgi:hypothetical protein
MPIGASEEVLLEAFRRLPPDAAVELSTLAQRLAALAPGTVIDLVGFVVRRRLAGIHRRFAQTA